MVKPSSALSEDLAWLAEHAETPVFLGSHAASGLDRHPALNAITALGTDIEIGLRILTARLAGLKSTRGLAAAVAGTLGIDAAGPAISCMEWIGLFSSDPLPRPNAPVDILTERMLAKMSYAEGERDMLVLQHTFVAEFADRREHITSTMIDFGIPGGDSSMNRTVGLPAAVGVRFILEGRFTKPGVIVPVMREFYEPALAELERLGIQFEENVQTLKRSNV